MKKRPSIISTFALLYLFEGCIFILIIITNRFNLFGQETNSIVGILSITFMLAIYAVEIAAGIGMWTRKYWAWYLWLFNVFSSVLEKFKVFVTTMVNADKNYSIDIQDFIGTISFVIINVFILQYITKQDIREYFYLKNLDKREIAVGVTGTFLCSLCIYLASQFLLLRVKQ